MISQNKTLKKHHDSSSALSQGLKSLSKQSRERLEAYQNLFYLLQTNPVYLAKLIFEMPQSRTTKFMESAILTLYNYASNQREEYLLLKLFKTALEEEIKFVIANAESIGIYIAPISLFTDPPKPDRTIVCTADRMERGRGHISEGSLFLVVGLITGNCHYPWKSAT